jgi:hypothetical protein
MFLMDLDILLSNTCVKKNKIQHVIYNMFD